MAMFASPIMTRRLARIALAALIGGFAAVVPALPAAAAVDVPPGAGWSAGWSVELPDPDLLWGESFNIKIPNASVSGHQLGGGPNANLILLRLTDTSPESDRCAYLDIYGKNWHLLYIACNGTIYPQFTDTAPADLRFELALRDAADTWHERAALNLPWYYGNSDIGPGSKAGWAYVNSTTVHYWISRKDATVDGYAYGPRSARIVQATLTNTGPSGCMHLRAYEFNPHDLAAWVKTCTPQTSVSIVDAVVHNEFEINNCRSSSSSTLSPLYKCVTVLIL